MERLRVLSICLGLFALVIACRSWDYDKDGINYKGSSFVGITVSEDQSTALTPEQKREQQKWDLKVGKQEKQENIGIFLIAVCLIGALACFVAAWLTEGWKMFGGLSAALGTCAFIAMIYVEMVQYIKYIAPVLLVIAGLWFLYKHRNVSLTKEPQQ